MCGRMTLTRRDFAEVADELEALYAPEWPRLYRPRYNVAPTDLPPICSGCARTGTSAWLQLASWGFFPVAPGAPC